MRLLKYILIMGLAAVPMLASAQTHDDEPQQSATIVDAINAVEGTVSVSQPMQLNRLVGREAGQGSTESKRGLGYRIQVFSDNNLRTAKANAEHRKHIFEQRKPHLRAYLIFESPYWRVKIGDFRSQSEANAALRELKEEFPEYSSDFRLIRERVNAQ